MSNYDPLERDANDEDMLTTMKVGIRNRRFWRRSKELAAENGIDHAAVRQWIRRNGLPPLEPTDNQGTLAEWLAAPGRRESADVAGIDWEGLTHFMEAMVPLIIALMESSSAL